MTSEEFATLVESVKTKLADLIETELVPENETLGEKVPQVLRRLLVRRDGREWVAKLQSGRHLEVEVIDGINTPVEKVHTFMIGHGGIDEYNPQNKDNRSNFWRLRFTIDSYYQDAVETDTDNPEKRHAAEVSRIAHLLKESRLKGDFRVPFPGVGNEGSNAIYRVEGFRERRGLARMGDVLVRESLAEVFVLLQPITID